MILVASDNNTLEICKECEGFLLYRLLFTEHYHTSSRCKYKTSTVFFWKLL